MRASSMDIVGPALRGGALPAAPPLPRRQTALVVGAGGTLGSALLAEALGGGRFERVAALVAGPLSSAMRGFDALPATALDDPPKPLGAELAFVVFERARHSNRRDEAFVQPDPAELPALAQRLHARGVRRLLVVLPHAPALLPSALKSGFASLAEGAVAALGFEQLVFVRAAQAAGGAASGTGFERFARWWLSQLRWMVPAPEQPLRAVKLAVLVVRLAQQLPAAPPGTRVLPPEHLWQAARAAPEVADALLSDWLGRP
jgi:hypothetical protein